MNKNIYIFYIIDMAEVKMFYDEHLWKSVNNLHHSPQNFPFVHINGNYIKFYNCSSSYIENILKNLKNRKNAYCN